ncbi:hypothetical protein QQS21_003049 [Conoideocrella luteorostrata]|uniref:Peptidase S53 domain-containing protein n=1 Tax=Conoideocrella luteorostrata TaxID=1105319 RepID=A0AAJ0CWG4_9HYPO|nr:hypothetical protein QQS21_003049 [Conoideocrella luteorostrata]
MGVSAFIAVFAACVAFPGLADCHSIPETVLHEKRDGIPEGWVRTGKASESTSVNLQIGLTQQNLHVGEKFLYEVSHPRSERYGQHWTPQEVINAFAPSENAISAASGRNWIKVKTTVEKAEKLLHTSYFEFENTQQGDTRSVVACESYSLPKDLQEHVDMITPTVHFDDVKKASPPFPQRRELQVGKFDNNKRYNDLRASYIENCAEQTTPECIRRLYNLSETREDVKNNSLGIVLYSPTTYSQDDLNTFFKAHAPQVPPDTAPDVHRIDGGFMPNGTGIDVVGEGNLDLSHAISLTHPLRTTLFQTGDSLGSQPATDNNFLDAIDGSYCSFEGGDDRDWDAIYPHNNTNIPGAYHGQPNCGTETPTHVISVSYGSNEGDRPFKYRSRQCTEFMKLGLMGVTILYASGDTGVAGLRGRCRTENGGWIPPGSTYGAFMPTWPAACPWVTAVGGTGLPKNGTINDKEIVAHTFSPGGGFSNFFALPDYQKEAVGYYYANHDPGYDSSRYNSTQQVRSYPDVALASQNFIISVQGKLMA